MQIQIKTPILHIVLYALETIGNVKDQSSYLVYLNICITLKTCENLNSIGRRSCEMKEKTPLSHEVLCFEMLDSETSKSNSEVSKSNSWKSAFSLENYVTSKGAVSHKILYHQPLPITLCQVRFYANNSCF